MVTVDTFISIDPIRLSSSVRYECDECGEECDQDSHDPRDWLFGHNGQQLCWHCLMNQADFWKVE